MGSFVIAPVWQLVTCAPPPSKAFEIEYRDERVKLCRSLFELVLLNMYSYPPSYIHVTKLVHLHGEYLPGRAFAEELFHCKLFLFWAITEEKSICKEAPNENQIRFRLLVVTLQE